MADSDNVMRGGLTPKHIDVDELLSVLDFTPGFAGLMPAPEDARDCGAIRCRRGNSPSGGSSRLTPRSRCPPPTVPALC